jgi:hypothetical protein
MRSIPEEDQIISFSGSNRGKRSIRFFENRLSLQQESALHLQLLEIGYTAPSLIKKRDFLSHSRAG